LIFAVFLKWRICGTRILRRKLFGAIIWGSRCLAGAIVSYPFTGASLWLLGRGRHF